MFLYRFPYDATRSRYRPRHRQRRIERQQRLLASAEPAVYAPSPELPNLSVALTRDGPRSAANAPLPLDYDLGAA